MSFPSSSAAPPPSASSPLSVEGGVQSFLSAFVALQHNSDPVVQQQANTFLIHFQVRAAQPQPQPLSHGPSNASVRARC